MGSRSVLFSVFCLGVSALVTQILLLRAFLDVFAGNELILGLILGSWLLLCGIGALCGRFASRAAVPLPLLVAVQTVISFLPLVQIVLVRLTRQFLPPGVVPGLGPTFLTAFLLLSPYCLLSGSALVLGARLISARPGPASVGRVYLFDTLGSIAGGLSFSFVLIFFLTPIQIAFLLFLLNLGAAAFLVWEAQRRRRLAVVWGGLAVLGSTAFASMDLEYLTARCLFPGLELIEQRFTPYGHLVVVRRKGQVSVFENGRPLAASDDRRAAEEMVHYALSQQETPRRVLLIGGGLQGAVAEAGKYPSVARMDYVELDPALIDLAGRLGGLGGDQRLHPVVGDARRFVRRAGKPYDAVLLDLPPPATAQLNRFYTVEFFEEVRQALSSGGVFALSVAGAENYADLHVRLLAASVYRSLKSVFPHVLAIPGGRIWFVASLHPLDYRIAERLRERGIETRYVRTEYLKARLSPDRIQAVLDMVKGPAPLNRDFAPVAYYVHLRSWLDRFGGGLLAPVLFLLGVGLILAVLLVSSPRRPVAFAVASSGFVGMGTEVLLLLAFQVLYGHVYHYLSLIVTAFLAGSALGTLWGLRTRSAPCTLLVSLDTVLAVLAFVLVPLLNAAHGAVFLLLHPLAAPFAFALFTAGIGFLVGGQIPAAARSIFRSAGETAGSLFALDLLGACAGALSISVFCIPLLGLEATCYLLGGLKLSSAAYLYVRRGASEVRVRPCAVSRSSAFGLALFLSAALGILISVRDTSGYLYAFTFAPAYHGFLLFLAAWGMFKAVGGEGISGGILPARLGMLFRRWYRRTRLHFFRALSFVVFAPVALYPVFRCYFKVPFLFCHVCPRVCVFGYLRPYLVPAALLMNLEKRYWCHHLCPLGTLHHYQAGVGGRGRRLPRWFFGISLAVLFFTLIGYFEVPADLDRIGNWPGDWYAFFFKKHFSVGLWSIGLAVLFLAAGFRWRRAFCDSLCPVGCLSELVQKGERRFLPGARVREEGSHVSPAS